MPCRSEHVGVASMSPPGAGRRNGAGFSLIELLVVLAIIVVLAGILLPTVATVRRTAHTAVCASNLRQLGMAVSAYRSDESLYPDGRSYASDYMNAGNTVNPQAPTSSSLYVHDQLAGYIDSTTGVSGQRQAYWLCPSRPDSGYGASNNLAWLMTNNSQYRYNYIGAPGKGSPSTSVTALLFFDVAWNTWANTDYAHVHGPSGFVQVVCADGHVGRMDQRLGVSSSVLVDDGGDAWNFWSSATSVSTTSGTGQGATLSLWQRGWK